MADTITSPFDPQMPFPLDLRLQRQSIAERNSISEFIRWEGMMVYVIDTQVTYQLQGGISNSQWVEIIGGTTDVLSTVLVGFTPNPDVPVTDSDTVLAAFGKLQAQINSIPTDPQNLQEVTVQGNTTDQAIHISGDNNDPATPGMSLIATPESGTAEIINRGGNSDIGWIFLGNMGANGAIRISPGGGNGAQPVTVFGGTTPTNNISITAPGKIICDPGTNPTDVVVLSQLGNYQLISEKGQPSGYAPLGVSGIIPSQYMPPIAITDTFIVGSEAEMLALTAQRGDVAVRTDIDTSFILQSEPASTLSNWIELLSPGSGVQSVNGLTGIVQLDLSFIDGLLGLTGSTPPINFDNRYVPIDGDISLFNNDAGYITSSNNRSAANPTAITDAVLYAGDLNSISNTSLIHSNNTATNIPPFATSQGGLITINGTNNAPRQLWFGRNGEIGIRGSSIGAVYDTWVQLATVDGAIQDLQAVTDEGSTTTNTISHAAATTVGQSLTTQNAGFGMVWNVTNNLLDWGTTQTIGAITHHSVSIPVNNAINLGGGPLGVDNPLFHLINNTDLATNEWQLRTTAASATNKAIFNGSGNTLQWRITDASNASKGIEISRLGQMSVIDSISEIGFRYNADYSANNATSPRWIPDKGYVDAYFSFQISDPVDFPAVPANSSVLASSTLSVSGIDITDSVSLANSGANSASIIYRANITAVDTITIRAYNITTSSVGAVTNQTFNLIIVKNK